MDSYIDIVFFTLLIVPIFLDEFLLKHGHFWTGTFLGVSLFYWICIGTSYFGRNLQMGNWGSDLMDLVYIIPWFAFIISSLLKFIWWKRFRQTTTIARDYRYRYLYVPIGMILLYYIFGLTSVLSIEPIYSIMNIFYIIGYLPDLNILISYLILPLVLLVSGIIYFLEKRNIPVGKFPNLRETIRKNIVWFILAGIVGLFLTGSCIEFLNDGISQYSIRLQESIRLHLPGQPGFHTISQATTVDDILFLKGINQNLASDCGCIYAVDMKSNQIIWSTETLAKEILPMITDDYPIYLSRPEFSINLISKENSMVVVSSYWEVFGLNMKTGAVVWRDAIYPDSQIWTNENSVLFVNSQGNLEKVGIITGNFIWETNTSQFDIVDLAFASDGHVVLELSTLSNYHIYRSVGIGDGMQEWETPRFFDNQNRILISDNYLIVASGQGGAIITIHAIDIGSGNETWKYEADNPTGVSAEVSVQNGSIFLTQEIMYSTNLTINVLSINLKTGQLQWRSPTHEFASYPQTLLLQHYIYYVDVENKEDFLVNMATGEEVPSQKPDSTVFNHLGANDLVLTNRNGLISAIEVDSKKTVWQSKIYLSSEYDDMQDLYARRQDVDSQMVYLTPERGGVVALDMESGIVKWSWDEHNGSNWTATPRYTMGTITGKNIIVYDFKNHNRVFILSLNGDLLFKYQ